MVLFFLLLLAQFWAFSCASTHPGIVARGFADRTVTYQVELVYWGKMLLVFGFV
jgi:hypothetical protein